MGAQVLCDLLEVEMGRGRNKQIRGIGRIEENKKKQDHFTKTKTDSERQVGNHRCTG